MLYHHEDLRLKVPQNSLGKAYETTGAHPWFQQYNPEISLSTEFQRYKLSSENTLDNLHHEAGYDALMTGILYARIESALRSHYGNAFETYHNKLYVYNMWLKDSLFYKSSNIICVKLTLLMYAHRYISSVTAFDLSAPNLEPTFENVVRIFNFPTKTKTWHIKNLFGQYLEPQSKGKQINVQWIGENSAWVFMCTESEINNVLKKARKTNGICKENFTGKKLSFADFDIETYATFKSAQSQHSPAVAPRPNKKRKRLQPNLKSTETSTKPKCCIS
mmetsp:Transcript_17694/g.21511  ORF Transcript_17694/g.21511 Transcript_17694/m.21511 type:complete len:276 (+) Transcript_17694:580-1407(+)